MQPVCQKPIFPKEDVTPASHALDLSANVQSFWTGQVKPGRGSKLQLPFDVKTSTVRLRLNPVKGKSLISQALRQHTASGSSLQHF